MDSDTQEKLKMVKKLRWQIENGKPGDRYSAALAFGEIDDGSLAPNVVRILSDALLREGYSKVALPTVKAVGDAGKKTTQRFPYETCRKTLLGVVHDRFHTDPVKADALSALKMLRTARNERRTGNKIRRKLTVR